jgi:hypothetical protein
MSEIEFSLLLIEHLENLIIGLPFGAIPTLYRFVIIVWVGFYPHHFS